MSVFSIAPNVRFLDMLAERVMDGTLLNGWSRNQPFWLTDITIIVPTRRARLGLADAFARHSNNNGLLPDIRTFGGEVEDEEPFLPPYDMSTPLPPATVLERRLALSRLVATWANSPAGQQAFSSPPTAGEILSMAESLGVLIDDLLTEERSAADIRTIVPELEAGLGAYWQQTLQFLDIALAYWPQHLAARGLVDPAERRGQRLDRQAQSAPLIYGERPVIAAGSTGSIPATRRLLKAIHRLPRGAVVLPGFDCSMSTTDHAALLDPINSPETHPQYVLAKLVHALGVGVNEVQELATIAAPRTTLVNYALALTKNTAYWAGQRLPAAALAAASEGLSLIQARNEDEEARAVALAARQALTDGQTVGIVTPDRNLARRIAAELQRFAVLVDDAAGTPLFQSAAGRLLRQILALTSSNFASIDLIALLRNQGTRFGRKRNEIDHLADAIELGLLRGQRPNPGISGLRAQLIANLDGTAAFPARRLKPVEGDAIEAMLSDMEAALLPLHRLQAQPLIDASSFVAALCDAFGKVTDSSTLPGKAELDDWAIQMARHSGEGHSFPPTGLESVLFALMNGFQVRTHEERRSDIAIWGQLEARLMNPDLLIFAALNEDKWPEPADPGPWLSRAMRIAAGLEPPERRQGQAAHDFAQAMGNATVIISYADRVGASPALPSRLVQRLDAFAGQQAAESWRAKGHLWLNQARRLDMVFNTYPALRPQPTPPASQRPRALSITEIETLMRSPYDIYAKHILHLKPLDPLGDDPDARERGTIIHDIFATFIEEGHAVMAENALDNLERLAREKFAGLEAIAKRRDIWLRRFSTTARQFLDFERGRNSLIHRRHAEIDGKWPLALSANFELRGRADRVDELIDGTLEIIDFKTGSPPGKGAMQAFEAPQLLLEVQMAKVGALKGIAPAETSQLTYIKVSLGPDAFVERPFILPEGYNLMDAANETVRRMQAHIEHFLMRDTPMPAQLHPLPGQRFAGAYDHLARVAEWTIVDGGEGSP